MPPRDSARRRNRALPRVEALEGRLVPASFTVTNLNDPGPGSLRQAISDADSSPDAASSIGFTNGLGGTIALVSKLPDLLKDISIGGLFSSIAVQCTTGDRVFTVGANHSCGLSYLTIFNGGIENDGSLSLDNCEVTQSSAPALTLQGGGIYNLGRLTLTSCTIQNNGASNIYGNGDGGGIYNYNGTVTCYQSTIAYNRAGHDGGGIFSQGAAAYVHIQDSFIAYNSAGARGGGIENAYGTVVMDGGELYGNMATNLGGGLDTGGSGAQVTLTSVQVTGNRVTDPAGKGGGFYLLSGSLTLNSITLSGNRAATGAGGAWLVGATLTINNPAQITDPIVEDFGP